jgi:hypothetical protein
MRPKGGWKSVTGVEISVAEYVDWRNYRRLRDDIVPLPPDEFEASHWAKNVVTYCVETPVPTRGWFQVAERPRNPGDAPRARHMRGRRRKRPTSSRSLPIPCHSAFG